MYSFGTTVAAGELWRWRSISRPLIRLRTDRRLALGECGIEANLVNAPSPAVVRRGAAAPPAGASAPLVVEVLPQAFVDVGGRQVAVGPRGSVIGRSSDSDIVIAVNEVSRHHAQITPDRDGWALADLGSTNGVRLNGRPLAGAAPLSPGDVIEIGTVELVFEVG